MASVEFQPPKRLGASGGQLHKILKPSNPEAPSTAASSRLYKPFVKITSKTTRTKSWDALLVVGLYRSDLGGIRFVQVACGAPSWSSLNTNSLTLNIARLSFLNRGKKQHRTSLASALAT